MEIPEDPSQPQLLSLLSKSVALQLKPASHNAAISHNAFELLQLLAGAQLDALCGELHRLASLQRRQCPAPGDLALLLRGFALTPGDLDVALQQQQHTLHSNGTATKALRSATMALGTPSSDTPFAQIEREQRSAAELVGTNASVSTKKTRATGVSPWLPQLPPDHTYRFTPQYNAAPRGPAAVRVRAVQEGAHSQRALRRLLAGSSGSSAARPGRPVAQAPVAQGSDPVAQGPDPVAQGSDPVAQGHRARRPAQRQPLPSSRAPRRFDVAAYAQQRIAVARQQVQAYEARRAATTDPFVALSRDRGGASRRALRTSLGRVLGTRGATRRAKAAVELAARARREVVLGEVRARRAAQEREQRSGLGASVQLETILLGERAERGERGGSSDTHSPGPGSGSDGMHEEDRELFGDLDGSPMDNLPLDNLPLDDSVDALQPPGQKPSFDIAGPQENRHGNEHRDNEHHVTIVEPGEPGQLHSAGGVDDSLQSTPPSTEEVPSASPGREAEASTEASTEASAGEAPSPGGDVSTNDGPGEVPGEVPGGDLPVE